MTGCKTKVITYPEDKYKDIYSDIVISGEDENLIDVDDIYSPDIDDIDHVFDNNTSSEDDPNIEDEDSEILKEIDDLGFDIAGGRAYKVSAYGAKGDGKTDDGPAINEAIRDAQLYIKLYPTKNAEIRFESNKTYAVKSRGESTNPGGGLISFYETKNITLKGNNTTIEGLPTSPYLYIQKCSNINVKGFNFTFDTPVACVATAVAATSNRTEFEVPKWYADCARKYTFSIEQVPFAIATGGLRHHKFFTTVEEIDDTHVAFDSYFPVGTAVYLPTPGYSHCGNIAFQVLHNTGTVTFEDINIWNASRYVFQINSNDGIINFLNVKLAPKDSSSCDTVAWRDVIHAKDNRQKLNFDKCVFKGTHDDIFNLSCTMTQIVELEEDNELRLYGLDYAEGVCPNIQEGDTVEVIEPYTGKFCGEARVVEVIANNRIRIDRDLQLEGGEYLYSKQLANPGTTVTNCEFAGTYRIKGSSTFENCKFDVLTMWFGYSGQNSRVEGPVGQGITFNNCAFTATMHPEGSVVIGFGCETIGGDPNTEYQVRDIVFNKCNFAYDGMLDTSKPYDVTVKN